MSKLLGPKLTMENLSFVKESPISTHGRRQYVCRVCQTTFGHYPGIKIVNRSGIAYCQLHHPARKIDPT